MATRSTQTLKTAVAAGAPNSARATQTVKTAVSGGAPNSTRTTQTAKVIVATATAVGNTSLPLTGIGT